MELTDLRQLITEVASEDLDSELGFLTGFVIVAEWAGKDGQRRLTATARDVNDDAPALWTVKGWLYQALDQADCDDEDGGD